MNKKNRNKIMGVLMLLGVALIMAGSTLVCAATEKVIDWKLGSYDAGWIPLGIGAFLVIMLLGAMIGWYNIPKGKGIAAVLAVILLVSGGFMMFATHEVTDGDEATTVTGDCCPFEITGAAITGVGDYITSTWDSTTNTLTVPLTVQDSSDGNLTGSACGVNLTIEAQGGTTTTNCIYTITSDDDTKYGNQNILDQTGNDYRAEITTSEGTKYGTDDIQITAGGTDWVNCSWFFDNGTSGNWVSKFTQTYQTVTWYLTVENSCGVTERVTIKAIVHSYSA